LKNLKPNKGFQKMSSTVTTFPDGVVGEWMEGTGKKKYKVVLYKTQQDYQDGRVWKTVQFGAKGYQQYQDQTPLGLYSSEDHLDEKRRENYQARHGAQGYQTREYSPAWFSWNYLW